MRPRSDRQFWLGLAVVYVLFFALNNAKPWRPGVVFGAGDNTQIAEAQAWWNGRLDLSQRFHDSALVQGRVYSHFPLMFTIIAAALVPFFHGVPHWFVVAAIALPLPLLAYILFCRVLAAHPTAPEPSILSLTVAARIRSDEAAEQGSTEILTASESGHRALRRFTFSLLIILPALLPIVRTGGDLVAVDWMKAAGLALPVPFLLHVLWRNVGEPPWREVLLTVGFLCGTSLWPVLDRTIRSGSPYFVNHTLAVIGLLILLIEMFGRRRVWAAGVGLAIATLSRQMTAAFAIPLLWLMLSNAPPTRRRSALIALSVIGCIIVGVPFFSNVLKFGSPVETGYGLIYEGRDDFFAQDVRKHGVFSPAFIGRNLYYINVAAWDRYEIMVAGRPQVRFRPNEVGTGIWWITPLLLWLFFDLPRILRSSADRSVLAAAALVFTALLFFHATGYAQRGYNRFSLDYLPGLFAVIAPGCFSGWRRWISMGMIAWSVVYFTWLI